MPFVRFRMADITDVDAVVALIESAYRGKATGRAWTTEGHLLDGQRTDAAGAADAIVNERGLMLLAIVDEPDEGPQILGCCQIEERGPVAYFGMFAVRPDRQGLGTGAALLAAAERYAVEHWGSKRMDMTVIRQREDLIAWYLRHGYRLTGATVPFPYGDERFGVPRRDDLEFAVLSRSLP